MRVRAFIFLFVVMMVPLSCRNTGEKEIRYPALLRAVPSDALGVAVFDEGVKAFPCIDSVFLKLPYGPLSSCRAVVSCHYDGSRTAMLGLELGRPGVDSIPSTEGLKSQAGRLGLHCRETGIPGGARVLLLSRSEHLLESACRHITEGASVLDAKAFSEALSGVPSNVDFAVFRNSETDKFIDFGLLSAAAGLKYRDTASFLKSVSEWIVMLPDADGWWKLKTTNEDDSVYYMNVLNAVVPSESGLCSRLPGDCDFFAGMQISSLDDYLAARKNYLDAHASLGKYLEHCGENELRARELDVREVAVVRRAGEKVLLVRAAGKPSSADIPSGFAETLFGKLFRMEDSDTCALSGDWIVSGSRSGVSSFLSVPADSTRKWSFPGKTSAIVYSEDMGKYILGVTGKSEMKMKVL